MAELLGALDRTLAGTAELPVDPRASTWLGEAAAVAADLAADVPADPVVRARVRTVRDLLESAGSTGNPEADERVAAALALAGRVLEE